jgi:hypothetical protein
LVLALGTFGLKARAAASDGETDDSGNLDQAGVPSSLPIVKVSGGRTFPLHHVSGFGARPTYRIQNLLSAENKTLQDAVTSALRIIGRPLGARNSKNGILA